MSIETERLKPVPNAILIQAKKDLFERVHRCDVCGYETDRDHAAAEVIRLRGLDNLSTQGLCGIKNAYAVGLPGVEEKSPSRSQTKSRKASAVSVSRTGRTRKAQS